MHPLLILQVLILASLANGVPVFAKKLLGGFCAWPLDGGARFLEIGRASCRERV